MAKPTGHKIAGHKLAAYAACLAWASGASIAWAQSPGTFTPAGSMITARSYGISATLLTDGKVLIAGGYTEGLEIWGSAPTAAAELYDPATSTFTPAGTMNSARAKHTATLLPDGRVLIAGGDGGGFSLTSTEIYDPSTGSFTLAGNVMPSGVVATAPPSFAPALSLMNGKTLFAGGLDDPGPDTYAAVWDPSTAALDPGVGQMRDTRADQSMTLLPDGKVLVAAGSTWSSVPPSSWLPFINPGTLANPTAMYHICCLSSAELFDPDTEQFTVTGSTVAPRSGHTATVLNSGEVLIVGGTLLWGEDNLFTRGIPAGASTELYHPVTLIAPPALLSLSGDGRGQAAVQHAGTYRIASADDPAVAGENLSIYLTGLAGRSVIPPGISIGGAPAEITFFGDVQQYPGLNQINIRMPAGVVPGAAVPMRLTYLGRSSNVVTIGVQ